MREMAGAIGWRGWMGWAEKQVVWPFDEWLDCVLVLTESGGRALLSAYLLSRSSKNNMHRGPWAGEHSFHPHPASRVVRTNGQKRTTACLKEHIKSTTPSSDPPAQLSLLERARYDRSKRNEERLKEENDPSA
ncbi:uncharacterized [Tachysurus ichikawai]